MNSNARNLRITEQGTSHKEELTPLSATPALPVDCERPRPDASPPLPDAVPPAAVLPVRLLMC